MKVLVVIDMQNDFIDGTLGTKEALKIVPKVVEKIKNYSGVVLATRDTHQENYLSTQEGKKLPVLHCVEGSEGWQLHPDIVKLIRTTPFDKATFGSIELAGYLKDLNDRAKLEEVELVGLCTDICVISNALVIKAALPETTVKVDSSCCAGVSPESHENALNAMKMCQVEVE